MRLEDQVCSLSLARDGLQGQLMKLSKIHIDIVKAVKLYQAEHGGRGMPEDPDILNFYIEKVHELENKNKVGK